MNKKIELKGVEVGGKIIEKYKFGVNK